MGIVAEQKKSRHMGYSILILQLHPEHRESPVDIFLYDQPGCGKLRDRQLPMQNDKLQVMHLRKNQGKGRLRGEQLTMHVAQAARCAADNLWQAVRRAAAK